MTLNLDYSKNGVTYQVVNAPKDLQLPNDAKTRHSKSTRPFQTLVNGSVAIVYPKFV